MGSSAAQTVLSGSLLLALPVAVLAGLISFFSPCVLPLVPGFLSYVTGLVGIGLVAQPAGDGKAGPTPAGKGAAEAVLAEEPATRKAGQAEATLPPDLTEPEGRQGGQSALPRARSPRATPRPAVGRVLLGSALFVVGFSTLFVAYGALFGQLGRSILQHQQALTRVLGVLTIGLAVVFLGVIPATSRSFTVPLRARVGIAGAPVLGLLFGLGWTPCLGPTLAAVQTLAFTQSSAARGALLSVGYCLGLAVPFLVSAVAFQRGLHAWGWMSRHGKWVVRSGAVMLLGLGVLMLTGVWTQWIGQMQGWISGFEVRI